MSIKPGATVPEATSERKTDQLTKNCASTYNSNKSVAHKESLNETCSNLQLVFKFVDTLGSTVQRFQLGLTQQSHADAVGFTGTMKYDTLLDYEHDIRR